MKIETILKINWLKSTQERLQIYNFINKRHIFSCNDLLYNLKNVWRASIFRTLKLFLEIWIIRKVNLWEKIETYELIDETHHHEHMKCENCENVISFESEDICNKILKEAEKKWFKIKSHNICITWVCKNCL